MMTREEALNQIEADRWELAETNLIELAKTEAEKHPVNFFRLRDILGLGVKVQELRLDALRYGLKAAEETKPATAEAPTHYGFSTPEGPAFRHGFSRNADTLKNEATAENTKPQATDLDTLAERILAAFKSEDETLTDATLLAASGLGRDKYTDIRDYLLYETEELSETVDGIPTEYIRNWPRKVQAAA